MEPSADRPKQPAILSTIDRQTLDWIIREEVKKMAESMAHQEDEMLRRLMGIYPGPNESIWHKR